MSQLVTMAMQSSGDGRAMSLSKERHINATVVTSLGPHSRFTPKSTFVEGCSAVSIGWRDPPMLILSGGKEIRAFAGSPSTIRY